MRHSIIVFTALFLAGCSPKSGSGPQDTGSADSAASTEAFDAAANRGPGISVTAAPGVAFNYNYLFRLPGQGIAKAQEAHAQACEKLGIGRCRITGMHYAVGDDPADVTATLDLKLDPTIARKFGTDGIDAIVKAGGRLGGADITGNDAGSAVTAIDRRSAQVRAELLEIDQRLSTLPAKAPERVALTERAGELREQLAEGKISRDGQVDSLANTPMTFRYAATSAIPGFDSGAPLFTGYLIGKQSLLFALTVLIVVISVGAPWLAFALLFGWIYRASGLRALRQRWRSGEAA